MVAFLSVVYMESSMGIGSGALVHFCYIQRNDHYTTQKRIPNSTWMLCKDNLFLGLSVCLLILCVSVCVCVKVFNVHESTNVDVMNVHRWIFICNGFCPVAEHLVYVNFIVKHLNQIESYWHFPKEIHING